MNQRSRNRIILFIATFALLVHSLIPFFAVYQLPAAPDAKSMASLFGDRILICSGNGFRFVSVKELANGKEHPKSHPQYQCALCYVAAQGQYTKPALSQAAIVSWRLAYHIFALSARKTLPASDSDWQKRRTRSPPASFTV